MGDSWRLEAYGLGTLGRKLITTDIINRDFSDGLARYNPRLPRIDYRANQGLSDYHAPH